MKLVEGFAVREVAGKSVAIATFGPAAKLGGMISLNETGKLLFSMLMEGCTETEMAAALTAEYEIDDEAAKADVARFLAPLREQKLIED